MTKNKVMNTVVRMMELLYGLDKPSRVHDNCTGGFAFDYCWGGNTATIAISDDEIRMNSAGNCARYMVQYYTREAAIKLFGDDWRDWRMWQHMSAEDISADYHGA